MESANLSNATWRKAIHDTGLLHALRPPRDTSSLLVALRRQCYMELDIPQVCFTYLGAFPPSPPCSLPPFWDPFCVAAASLAAWDSISSIPCACQNMPKLLSNFACAKTDATC
eukprot:1155280-Pelagomonas_calceolata.AAC.3